MSNHKSSVKKVGWLQEPWGHLMGGDRKCLLDRFGVLIGMGHGRLRTGDPQMNNLLRKRPMVPRSLRSWSSITFTEDESIVNGG